MMEQEHPVHQVEDAFECWNLQKFRLDDFVSAVQDRIPPINENALRNYRTDAAEPVELYGISETKFQESSWGLLLPESIPDTVESSYAETLFLLNLYSSRFLHPTFYVGELGIYRLRLEKDDFRYYGPRDQANVFKRPEFPRFYEALISESARSNWQAFRVARWGKEDWRLFVACLLFKGLKKYEGAKSPFTWQRESADMATILESLFTAGTGDDSEVGYKLRKRVAALLESRQPGIEKEIKELYSQRSQFVHGSFFVRAMKDTQREDHSAKLPMPDFQFLQRQKEHVRQALAAYLYVNKLRSSGANELKGSVLEILESSIINLDVRATIRKHAETILNLM
jgi:hypothetical protein